MLAGAYERLRRDAVNPPAYEVSLHGLAIFTRKGMAAWMKACVMLAPAADVSQAPATGALFPSIQRDVVDVLAAMALRTATEVRT